MPYVAKELRKPLEQGKPADNAGELNYQLTRLVHSYITRRGLSYSVLNEVIGALECAKQELYRRVAAPYENEKIAQNGDVTPERMYHPAHEEHKHNDQAEVEENYRARLMTKLGVTREMAYGA